jgi:23S rRNA (cytosine1962-C5)-methyltransferase
MAAVILKAGREKSLIRRHPWVFSGAIATVKGPVQSGETIDIMSSKGDLLARGAYSPHSQITVRIWSFDPHETISAEFFRARLRRALELRRLFEMAGQFTAYRLVNAESDNLPGVIVDRYGDFLVCQFLTTGAEYWKHDIVVQLAELVPHRGIYERSDVDVREKEGLSACTGILAGQVPPDRVAIQEGTLRFWVDIQHGHKTGFYLDQRDNRACLAEYSEGAEVLNCFAYTGGFGIYALKHKASRVIQVETSDRALELARNNVELNGLDMTKVEYIQDDVFQVLRRYRDSRRQFDLIILDPPKFVESRNQLKSASRGYKDINLLAMKLLRPGGILLTFSCSGLLTMELFQKIIADAALDAGRDAQIIRRLSQASDHPVALCFPEGSYLKGFVCKVW